MSKQEPVDLPVSGVTFTPVPPQDRGTMSDPLIRATRVPAVDETVHITAPETSDGPKTCREAIVTAVPDEDGRLAVRVLQPEALVAVPAHHIDECNAEWPRTTDGTAGTAFGREPWTWHWPEQGGTS